MKVVEARLTTQGRVGFASREVGRLADTSEYILNTALYYALGFASGRYVDTEFRPTYIEDTEGVSKEVYITPAAPVESPSYSTAFYNARGDDYANINYSAEDDPQQNLNVPRFGSERRFTHGNQFQLFMIPKTAEAREIREQTPQYVRVGKKRGKVRVDTKLHDAKRSSGEFLTNHPIGVNDYANTPIGNVVSRKMRPTPIILQGKYEGEYLSIPSEGSENTKLPADLTFLEEKR